MTDDLADQSANRPASQRVADALKSDIDSGEYAVGARLPSYRDLMAIHGVALGTAQAAVRILEREGRVRVEHGKGTIVLDRTAPRPAASQLRELREELVALKGEARRAVAVVSDLEGRIGTLADRIELEA